MNPTTLELVELHEKANRMNDLWDIINEQPTNLDRVHERALADVPMMEESLERGRRWYAQAARCVT